MHTAANDWLPATGTGTEDKCPLPSMPSPSCPDDPSPANQDCRCSEVHAAGVGHQQVPEQACRPACNMGSRQQQSQGAAPVSVFLTPAERYVGDRGCSRICQAAQQHCRRGEQSRSLMGCISRGM